MKTCHVFNYLDILSKHINIKYIGLTARDETKQWFQKNSITPKKNFPALFRFDLYVVKAVDSVLKVRKVIIQKLVKYNCFY